MDETKGGFTPPSKPAEVGPAQFDGTPLTNEKVDELITSLEWLGIAILDLQIIIRNQ